MVFWGFEGKDVKLLFSNPQKALLCVNTRLLVYCMSKSVQRPGLSHLRYCDSAFQNLIRFNICCSTPNVVKIGQYFHWEMVIQRFSKWRPSAILDFKNLPILSCSPSWHGVLLPHTKFRWNLTIRWWVMAKKAIFKMAAAVILNFKNFNSWSRDCNLVQYLL